MGNQPTTPGEPERGAFVGGFDLELGRLTLDEQDATRVLSRLRAFRRMALRKRAKASASKCLIAALPFGSPRYRLSWARRLVREVQTVATLRRLAIAEQASGHLRAAYATLDDMLVLAERVGDLDSLAQGKSVAVGWNARELTSNNTYRTRILAAIRSAERDPSGAYKSLRRSLTAAEVRDAHYTAVACGQGLVLASAQASDPRSGARFAHGLAQRHPSSWSYLALGFFEEHMRHPNEAARAYVEAARLAQACGDLHHLQQSSVGLARLGGAIAREMSTKLGSRLLKAYPSRPPLSHIRQLFGLYWSEIYGTVANP
jgi:hypothetical protein